MVFVTVSSNPNITSIRNEIAEGIGLRFEWDEDEFDRAQILFETLYDGRKFLIVLDDICERLALTDIRIPIGKDCKLILTSRSQHICDMMDCQFIFNLSVLTDEEAWEFFQFHAGVIADTLEDFSLEITKKCQGVPIVIEVVARSLKHAPTVVWEESLKKLRDDYSLNGDIGFDSFFFKCFKLCIDNLENDELRSLLLLCSLFPEDSNIAFKILLKFAIGLGIFGDADPYERARSQVGVAIGKLLDSGLLLAKKGQFVHMHGMVREVALGLAQKTHVTVRDIVDPEAFVRRIHVEVTRLSCYDIHEFPYQLNFPKLEILFVSTRFKRSPKFADDFLKEMLELKVLAMFNTFVQEKLNLLLPPSMGGLKNLRTLCLNGWILGNISILGELKMLGTLELICCVIEELPTELASLRKLKLLEVSRCDVGGAPFKVIEKCSQLEELYFVSNVRRNEIVSTYHAIQLLHQIGSSEVLQRYHLEFGIGIYSYTSEDDLRSRVMYLDAFYFDAPSATIKNLARKLEVFHLKNTEGHFDNVVPGMILIEGEYMNELIELQLCNCDDIECLVDFHQLSYNKPVFSKLLKLKLIDMRRLKALCYGQPPSGIFEKLEELLLMHYEQLPSLSMVTC